MKRLVLALGVSLCGCAMSVMGAETPVREVTVADARAVVGESAGMETKASTPIRKEGVPLTADPRYEQLFSLSEDGKTDDGVYLVKNSIHVTDVVNDVIFATVTVVEAQPEDTACITMEFCIDGFGKMHKKGADGIYRLLPEKPPFAEMLAEEAVLDAFSDATKWEGFLKEMQEIAVRKAGLDTSEDMSDGEKSAETKGAGKENAKRAGAAPLSWREFTERVQTVWQEEEDARKEEEKTQIDVVISSDADEAYEEKKVEPDMQKVTVSIQSAQ